MIISDLTYFEDASEAGSIVGGTTKKDDKKNDKKIVKKIVKIDVDQETGDVDVKINAKNSKFDVTAISGDNVAVISV